MRYRYPCRRQRGFSNASTPGAAKSILSSTPKPRSCTQHLNPQSQSNLATREQLGSQTSRRRGRCRANSAHVRYSGPDHGLDLNTKVLVAVQVVSLSLGRGSPRSPHLYAHGAKRCFDCLYTTPGAHNRVNIWGLEYAAAGKLGTSDSQGEIQLQVLQPCLGVASPLRSGLATALMRGTCTGVSRSSESASL